MWSPRLRDGHDVEQCDGPLLESAHDVCIHGFRSEIRLRRMNGSQREMQQVVYDEQTDYRSAPDHRAGSVAGLLVLVESVADRPRRAIPDSQLRRGKNMQTEGRKQDDPSGPEHFRLFLQESGVGVQHFRTREYLEVPDEMADDEPEKGHSRHGHDDLLADRRAVGPQHPVHCAYSRKEGDVSSAVGSRSCSTIVRAHAFQRRTASSLPDGGICSDFSYQSMACRSQS